MTIKIENIDWDLYDEDEGRELTPEEAGVETEMTIEAPDGSDPREVAAAVIDKADWCVKNYDVTVVGTAGETGAAACA